MPEAGKGYSGSLYNLYHRKRSNDNKEQRERCQPETYEEETALSEAIGRLKTL